MAIIIDKNELTIGGTSISPFLRKLEIQGFRPQDCIFEELFYYYNTSGTINSPTGVTSEFPSGVINYGTTLTVNTNPVNFFIGYFYFYMFDPDGSATGQTLLAVSSLVPWGTVPVTARVAVSGGTNWNGTGIPGHTMFSQILINQRTASAELEHTFRFTGYRISVY